MKRRKSIRLSGFDYSSHGAYFLTVCTHLRERRFGEIRDVGAGSPGPFAALSATGNIILQWIPRITIRYPSVSVLDFVIMPDHIHLILYFDRCKGPGDPAPTPKLGEVMGWFKYQTTKEANSASENKRKLWQRGYYEHILRSEQDYLDCAAYLAQNPAAWLEKNKP